MRLSPAQARRLGIPVVGPSQGRTPVSGRFLKRPVKQSAAGAAGSKSFLDSPIEFVIVAQPKGKASVRTDPRRPQSPGYIPTSTRRYMSMVSQYARNAMAGRPPHDGACSIELLCEFAPPASWPVKQRRAALDGQIACDRKPDGSNILKLIEDALNQIVFADDRFVCESIVRKRWAPVSRVTVKVVPFAIKSYAVRGGLSLAGK